MAFSVLPLEVLHVNAPAGHNFINASTHSLSLCSPVSQPVVYAGVP